MRSITSSVMSPAVGPTRSVQKVLLINVDWAASITSRRPHGRGEGVAVTERFAEDGHVGFYAISCGVRQMSRGSPTCLYQDRGALL